MNESPTNEEPAEDRKMEDGIPPNCSNSKKDGCIDVKGESQAENDHSRFHKPRRSSMAAIKTRKVPLGSNPEVEEDHSSFVRQHPDRRASFTKIETNNMLRHSLAPVNRDQVESDGIQKLRERFERRGSVMTSNRSNHYMPSMIGSVVKTNVSEDFYSCTQDDQSNRSIAITNRGTNTSDSAPKERRNSDRSIPFSEVHHLKRARKKGNGIQREQLIECLVNFSSHIANSVLEDLVSHELEYINEVSSKDLDEEESTISGESFSSLSSGAKCSVTEKCCVDRLPPGEPLATGLQWNRHLLPPSRERESALLFVDITGFTKLSTVLDVESLSKVINSYFEMIVTEVIMHGGDILKFAGDAFFAEWRESSTEEYEENSKVTPMQQFNLSLSNQDSAISLSFDSSESNQYIKSSMKHHISSRVWQATRCAASIVEKFSDFHVSIDSMFTGTNLGNDKAMLDVHCGIGAGRMVGLHVSDFQEDADDDAHEDNDNGELRREFIVVGDAINQVSRAAHLASNGEVLASPEAVKALSACCDIPQNILNSVHPVHIASKSHTFVSLEPFNKDLLILLPDNTKEKVVRWDNIRQHCEQLNDIVLARLHLQVALYVHPVVRGDEISRSMPIVEAPESRHLEEAELRSVYTMFINALVPPILIGEAKIDAIHFQTLRDIMHVTSRELDRYSGQLRQFIVDDKGVVLIATFGLRGSTFPNLVANNGLPATFSIHKALKEELGVDNRIGASFGQVYCGVVGGLRRHEFSVMGAPVNLAARLMACSSNTGILVNDEVRIQADARFAFRSLQPIKTKGYEKPVTTLQPLYAIQQNRRRGNNPVKFTGRQEEKSEILGFVQAILDDPMGAKSSVIGLIGESGIGKSALGLSVMGEVKFECLRWKKKVICLRSTIRESEQRIPLCTFRKILLGAIREMCEFDESIKYNEESMRTGGSLRRLRRKNKPQPIQKLSSDESLVDKIQTGDIPYLDKINWACEEIGYSTQYANLLGSRFLGLESAHPVTHVQGRVPSMSELVEFIAQAFEKITGFADLVMVFVDDFQWVDNFTWKVIRALGQNGKKVVFICAMRSHDKQAVRRISTAVNFRLEITLGPLDIPDIKQLAISVLGCNENTIDAHLCTDIYQMTGGLPVFVIEMLEDMKRNKAIVINEEGKTRLSESQLATKGKGNNALVEALLNRFDALDARVRKILQTCAVLGNSFAYSDVVRVHRELDEVEIKECLEVATGEMILLDIVEDDLDDGRSVFSSTSGRSPVTPPSIDFSGTTAGFHKISDHYFEFSHDMWRSNVLKTMLKVRKIELHRQIAQTMEMDKGTMIRRSDISRLLTLYYHWKSCGDFRKSAPLALTVGTRLNEWDLHIQSRDLYKDTLDLCYESVDPVDDKYRYSDDDDWVEVTSDPDILDLILRLHVRIAESHRILGEVSFAVESFQDAYQIFHSSSKASQSNIIPILAGLCSAKLEKDPEDASTLLRLIHEFTTIAQTKDNPIHILRALSLEAAFFAQQGKIKRALTHQQELQKVYDIQQHSDKMVKIYGKDYALECLSQSVLWYSLAGELERASWQADFVIRQHLPHQDPKDIDSILALILPALLTYKSTGRAIEADYVMKRYVINAFHNLEKDDRTSYWVEMFNPICYLLEIVKMQDARRFDSDLLDKLEDWVLEIKNSYFSPTHLRLGHTIMGEMCYRLGTMKNKGDPLRVMLLAKSKLFLTPIARDTHAEPFLAHSAFQLLRGL